MSEWIPASPGEDGSTPVPRDPPDQQATGEPDAWDLDVGKADDDGDEDSAKAAKVPATDEGGTARRGKSDALESHPEKPVPDEPTG
ncbi:hypothetical protein GCM10010277_82480 [Streptomyces longisporoflavus]|uniref:hypothetical protein n=1 Tax=Streptomyces longisporoflavus TaxID=28044 RepID=UPI00167D87A2|nr:hypothetical protein [Streptomyces longisporoflavus]GGV70987.1 hypothetical protein GCM10010277_82480 [Streptomyces longisporoflavus]